ncbi:PREDICTED: uncharacterized protein LOC104585884 [Nelumbo nucifera]|uniref:Uncharacterized protein LOC104585884 n=2 Tax=Nelumbo nucifera TaxID=4432 RepID=A0A1U7YMX3_NELNU|nr:PREDICTED: uncharacterized protein LOC104585884 [Nelumbo nucifera]XP_010241220.1 PREDICTED: uncharacterized protein LOC104585884 [Nelumbo nucifera]DAD33443.1 TPA_asm: hypothetical protein HUJ06_012294 [Nelumbo nucifera]
MRGVGGPLLCIGDLLGDVGERDGGEHREAPSLSSSSSSGSNINACLQPVDLKQLFQENYNQLNEALAGTDHSWSSLTLKLCTALETADKLVQFANSNAKILSEKVEELENIVKREDSAVAAAKVIHLSRNKK